MPEHPSCGGSARPCRRRAAVSVPAVLVLFFGAHAAGPSAGLGAVEWPDPDFREASPEELGMDRSRLLEARDHALQGEGSGIVVRAGRRVLAWGDLHRLYDLKSSTKSIGAVALGLALLDGKVRLEARARALHPSFAVPPEENSRTGWLAEITLFHLATHTAGFEKPGGYTRLLHPPGKRWRYSDGGPNWLAECLTLAYRRDMEDLLFERVFSRIGIGREDLRWRTNAYRPAEIEGLPRREFGSGVHASVEAMARLGYLHLRGGEWKGERILPREFVEAVGRPASGLPGLPVDEPDSYSNASDHYGLLWWNNADGTLRSVPRDAYWSWGLYESLIVVIPSLDLVAARAGSSWPRREGHHYAVLEPFLAALAGSVKRGARGAVPPPAVPPPPASPPAAPPSSAARVIRRILWDHSATILHLAPGSDNWPSTWGDDDVLYTAYGDGRGFEPFAPEKLSLGLARVRGHPPDLRGENVPAPTLEARGDGPSGVKASGLLMVEGVLYLLARNAGNSRLAWSGDRGTTWTWSPWRFTESFGCPTFLNFGRNYEGARDSYVYIYSPDSESAYRPADRMVLARVPRDRLREREAYEFFQGLDGAGKPLWTADLRSRGAVFAAAGRCSRSGISHHPGLKRYLWCQAGPGEDLRFGGGFSVLEAPEPWGPWTTVFSTETWDVAPGETMSFPTRWMDPGGRRLHLLFSGEDSFSVRGATLELEADAQAK